MNQQLDRPVRILYLFKGASRRALLQQVNDGEASRSPLRGWDVLNRKHDLEVAFIDVNQEITLPSYVPGQVRELILLPRLLRYDYIVTFDALLLCTFASWVGKVRVTYMAINAAVLVRRHQNNWLRTTALLWMWNSFWRIICIAESQRDVLLGAGVKENRITIFPFGIDADFFASVRYDKDGDYMVSIGRDLGRDFKTLFDAVRDLPYKLVVATDYKNIPPGLDIPKNVEIRYNLSIDQVRELYEGARFTCLILKGDEVSEGSDCTGQTVMLEALSAGQPAIVTEREWVREYFQDGKDYVGVPENDSIAVREAIERLWGDGAYRNQLSQNGRQKVQTQYSVEKMAESVHALITKY
ncbi:MAG TPA: glycosyltransferase family 4 protein [Candidatus Paceibacterota bacterium]|nr:glycosyltransferase family 4 protein [Candidatus Paceibacterota bacterium]